MRIFGFRVLFSEGNNNSLYPTRWVSIPCVLVASTLQCLLGGRDGRLQYSKFCKVWRHAVKFEMEILESFGGNSRLISCSQYVFPTSGVHGS